MTFTRINLRVCLAIISAAAALVAGSTLPMAAQEPQGRPRLRVEVNLVSLIVSVTDSGGRPIAGLPRESFSVTEDGQPQKLEIFESETQIPLDLVLMIDTSLSALKELEFEKSAANRFIQHVVRPGDGLSVFGFADTVQQYTGFTSNPGELESGVRRIAPGAGTSLYDAVYLGGNSLARRPAGRRRVIVLVTDAGETTSSASFEEARRSALLSEAMIYTVVTQPVKSDAGRNLAGEHALSTITDATGGAMFTSDDLQHLDSVFEQISRELRAEYRLGYYPNPAPPPGSMRNIVVKVTALAADRGAPAGYAVRHRKVYFTGGKAE
ncbi:MAG: VWA domain-containing protein [Acidipila sp.]|nr:VWA domain-containing protein [Acidipila sp.]